MNNLKLSDYEVGEPGDERLSLTKLVGTKPVDIIGYICRDSGVPVFQISKVLMENGAEIWVEGEHDCAYMGGVVSGTHPHIDKMLSEEVLDNLWEQERYGS